MPEPTDEADGAEAAPPDPDRAARLSSLATLRSSRPSRPPLRRQLRNLLLLLLLSVVVSVVGIVISRRIMPPANLLEVGARAPAIAPQAPSAPPALDQVAARTGHPFVVEFFGVNCPACQQAAPPLCDLLARHPEATLVAVDADLESDQQIAGYRQDRFGGCASLNRITFLADPCARTDSNGACGDNVTVRWKVTHTPTLYLVDSKGTIAFAGVGAGAVDPADQALSRLTAASPAP